MDGREARRWAKVRARVALGSLVLFKRKVLFSHLVVTAVLLVVAFFIVDALNVEHTLLVTIAVELVIVLVVFAVPRLLASWTLRADLARINAMFDATPAQGLSVMLRLVALEVRKVEDRLRRLRATTLGMPIKDASDWTRWACFKATRGRYLATDSNPPHRYLTRYREYLSAHEEYLRRTGRSDSKRFLVISSDDLTKDRQQHRASYDEFVDWHYQHGVKLFHVERGTALKLAHEAGLSTTDMAFWENELVLLWITSGQEVHIRLAFMGELLFEECKRYLEAIEKKARDLAG